MSESELRDRYIARLEAERDRIVAGCRATADWLERLLPPGVLYILGGEEEEFRAKVAALRRLFLPAERSEESQQ